MLAASAAGSAARLDTTAPAMVRARATRNVRYGMGLIPSRRVCPTGPRHAPDRPVAQPVSPGHRPVAPSLAAAGPARTVARKRSPTERPCPLRTLLLPP